MRIGVGYDSHRLAEGRPLILAGVTIPFDRGLAGHSDADAVAHALIDAVLGAAALGDVGTWFPPTDPRWRDADSMELLRAALRRVEEENYQVVNVDVTVVCEAPRLLPHVPAMRERVAAVLDIPVGQVSIKGKTNEGMGWIGKGEGIAVIAVALLDAVLA